MTTGNGSFAPGSPVDGTGEIAPWTRAILGFDQRPQGVRGAPFQAIEGNSGAGLWPTEIAALYGIPLDPRRRLGLRRNHRVGRRLSGFRPCDRACGNATAGPVVIDEQVAGNGNNFGGGASADEEIALDLQIVAGLLPNARIVVYFHGNTTQSLVGAIKQAVFDDVNKPQVLSVSWGSAETFWTPAGRDALQSALADAIRLRVSVVFAAGDDLATGGLMDGKAHVWFPASSPYVLGCGGTLPTLGSDAADVTAEAVWNDEFSGTGGGISELFPVPDYQSKLTLPPSVNDGKTRRGVPDVAGDSAANRPGYRIILNGQAVKVKDGTSAVAPLWAALIAIANAQRGTPLGFLNPALYSNARCFVRSPKATTATMAKAMARGWAECVHRVSRAEGCHLVAALAVTPAS